MLSFLDTPPAPMFLPTSLIDLSSKVYILTSPTHTSLAKILYDLHATIYIACTSSPPYENAAAQLRTACPKSKGHLKPFICNPSVLSSTRSAVDLFLEAEWRLDVLFLDTKDNMLSFLLAKLLLPIMHATASHFCHMNSSIRAIWISSSPAAVSANNLYLLAKEFEHREHDSQKHTDSHSHTLRNSNPSGVQHVVVDISSPWSNLQRCILRFTPGTLKGQDYIAFTLLYAGLAPDVKSGDWVVPQGRKRSVPDHVRVCITGKNVGEKSVGAKLYDQCEEMVKPFI
jgi:retinol dehydrogenase-12